MRRADLSRRIPSMRPAVAPAWLSRPWISTADFAESHFVLVTGPDRGRPFQHAKSPYARLVMDIWDRPWTRKMFVIAPSQTTKTTIAYCCLQAELYRDPSPAGIGMGNETMLRQIMEEKIGRHYLRSAVLHQELAGNPPSAAVQVSKIYLQGGIIYGMWAGSESSMSSISMRVVIIDEEDAYAERGLARTMEERVIAYPDDSKIMRLSKPRGTMAESSIWADMQRQAQAVYQWEARCPHCGTYQVMDKDRIVLASDERVPAEIRQRRLGRYRCAGCGALWTDSVRNRAVAAGRGVTTSTVSRPEIVGVHLPSWLSPQISLSAVLADWFEAHQSGTVEARIRFDNNHKAMPGNVIALETDEDRVRAMITDRPPNEVPAEAWALTCGIDVQMVGFYFVVRAWARDGRSWLVQYGFLDDWSQVDRLLDSTWPVEDREDVVMPLWRAAVDIGGHETAQENAGWSQTEETKNWLYERADRELVYGVKGASRKQDLVVRASTLGRDPDFRARAQAPITIRLLDTDVLKQQVQGRMHRGAEHAPMWLHRETDAAYIRQICSERQVIGKDGRVTWEVHGANHYLDCEVYACACAHVDWALNMRQSLHQPDWRPVRVPAPVQSAARPGPLAGRRINPWR